MSTATDMCRSARLGATARCGHLTRSGEQAGEHIRAVKRRCRTDRDGHAGGNCERGRKDLCDLNDALYTSTDGLIGLIGVDQRTKEVLPGLVIGTVHGIDRIPDIDAS